MFDHIFLAVLNAEVKLKLILDEGSENQNFKWTPAKLLNLKDQAAEYEPMTPPVFSEYWPNL